VPKDLNPPNVPQLRSIERFWANLKRKVYENGWTAKSVDLVKKIKSELKKIPLESCQNLLKRLKTKIRKAADRRRPINS
jgi:transposase